MKHTIFSYAKFKIYITVFKTIPVISHAMPLTEKLLT